MTTTSDRSRPLRVALLANSYLPYLSGVTISIDTLAQALRQLGQQVKIFAPAYPPDRPVGTGSEGQIETFRFRSLGTPFYPKFRLAYPLTLAAVREFRDFRPDIIHSHTPFLTGTWGQLMARRLKIPYVLTFHTLFTEYLHYLPLLPPALTKRPAIWYLRAFCQRSDAVIVPSQPIKKLLEGYGVKKEIRVIPTGLPLEQFYPWKDRSAIRRQFDIPEDAVLLINAGRLGREKNLDFLLEAFANIQRQAGQARLLLAGSGPFEAELKAKAAVLGLADLVVFAGEVPHERIGAFYQAADIFVSASLTETQGLVLTEAKAAGLPVVALNAFGTGEMVRHGRDGYLCDRDSFADSVLELIVSPGRRAQMSKESFLDAQERFSAPAMAAKALDLYRSML